MRKREIRCGKKTLQLPCFFASVSSVKSNFPLPDYIAFLETCGFPSYLVSAYDVINARDGSRGLNNIKLRSKDDRDSIVTLDSGNYEASWFLDYDWSYSSYYEAMKTIGADLFLSFDDNWRGAQRDQKAFTDVTKTPRDLIPIVHGNPVNISEKVVSTAMSTESEIIAIPERELGDGIAQRASTLQKVRKSLEVSGQSCMLHLLGTGDPRSILLYAACGADSFDGLEWCQRVVDPISIHLLDFSQGDTIECNCPACTAGETSYSATILGHNLLFYIEWMSTIQKYLRKGEIMGLLERCFPDKVMKKTGPILPHD